MARQANPRLQSPQLFARSARGKSSDQFLKELEDLLKLNRGGFSTVAEDTGADTGFIVPGGIASGMGQFAPEIAGQTRFTNAVTPPEYPEIPQAPEYQSQLPQQDLSSAQGFFGAVAQNLYSPSGSMSDPYQTPEGYGLPQPIQQLPDGSVKYSDGSVRSSSEAVYPVATMGDGNTLWSDGFVRPSMPDYAVGALSGESALSRGLFGRDQTVTQPYGNINPIEPTPGNVNTGTDFRTRDLETGIINYFDQPLEVVESYNQAQPGTGRVGNRENQGYGNSLLLRFQDGTMIRVSHLDYNPYQAGDVINPGDFIGTPGSTGNVTGEHADVEVYNAQGEVISPQDFMTQVREMGSQSREPLYRYDQGETTGPSSQMPQQEQPTMLEQARQNRGGEGSLIQSIAQPSVATGIAQTAGELAGGDVLGAATQAAETIDTANPTGQFDLGLTEKLREPGTQDAGDVTRQQTAYRFPNQGGVLGAVRQSLGNITESIGDAIPGVGEGYFSEAIAGGPTAKTGTAFASDELGQQSRNVGTPAKGVLQSLGDVARDVQASATRPIQDFATNIGNIGRDVQSQVGDISNQLASFQPGAGLEKLKQGDSKSGGAGVNLFSRRKVSDLSPERVVGKSAGGNLLATPTVAQASAQLKRDTSDPFFKSQLFEKVRDFTNLPGEIRDQALSQDVFKPEFYSDPGRVSSVFSETYMEEPALRRATESVKDAYRQAYAGSEYDQADVDRILSQLPDVLNYTPNLQAPRRAAQESGIKPGDINPQTGKAYAVNPATGNWDDNYFASTFSGGRAPSISEARSEGTRSGSGVGAVQQVSGRTVQAPQGTTLRVDSSGGTQAVEQNRPTSPTGRQYNLDPAPVSQPSAQPSSNRSGGIFDRAKQFAGGIFNRFFN